MATVSTTYVFLADHRSLDRSATPTWSVPPVDSSSPQGWRWVPAPKA